MIGCSSACDPRKRAGRERIVAHDVLNARSVLERPQAEAQRSLRPDSTSRAIMARERNAGT